MLRLSRSAATWCAFDVEPAGMFSDHTLVVCRLPLDVEPVSVAEKLVRGWRCVDRAELRRVLEDSELCRPPPDDADVDTSCSRPTTRSCMTSRTTSRRCAASVASVAVCLQGSMPNVGAHGETVVDWSVGIGEHAVWRTAGCGLRQHVAGSTYIVGRRTSTGVNGWCAAIARRHCCGAHCHLCLDEIATCPAPPITRLTALQYFLLTRSMLFAPTQLVSTSASSSLSCFRQCTEKEVRRLFMSAPVKSCSLDPVRTFQIHEFVDLLLPFITKMVNTSLAQGRLSTSQKHAIVTPLLNKPGLDTSDMGNYRPVSNLSFMSKLVEWAVASQLND